MLLLLLRCIYSLYVSACCIHTRGITQPKIKLFSCGKRWRYGPFTVIHGLLFSLSLSEGREWERGSCMVQHKNNMLCSRIHCEKNFLLPFLRKINNWQYLRFFGNNKLSLKVPQDSFYWQLNPYRPISSYQKSFSECMQEDGETLIEDAYLCRELERERAKSCGLNVRLMWHLVLFLFFLLASDK